MKTKKVVKRKSIKKKNPELKFPKWLDEDNSKSAQKIKDNVRKTWLKNKKRKIDDIIEEEIAWETFAYKAERWR